MLTLEEPVEGTEMRVREENGTFTFEPANSVLIFRIRFLGMLSAD